MALAEASSTTSSASRINPPQFVLAVLTGRTTLSDHQAVLYAVPKERAVCIGSASTRCPPQGTTADGQELLSAAEGSARRHNRQFCQAPPAESGVKVDTGQVQHVAAPSMLLSGNSPYTRVGHSPGRRQILIVVRSLCAQAGKNVVLVACRSAQTLMLGRPEKGRPFLSSLSLGAFESRYLPSC